jgi:1-deoxy-D-xylulose-5-phosphate reductoisomerase
MSDTGTKKKVIILGSTGSIGTNTLSVIRKLPDLFEVEALSCRNNLTKLSDQIEEFDPRAVAVAGELKDEEFKEMCGRRGVRVFQGNSGQLEMIEQIEADLVVNSISGSDGLLPLLKALKAGRQLANANKESIVMAGPLIRETLSKSGLTLIPVDSEHFAIFSLMTKVPKPSVDRIILTASGGPFRDLPIEQWETIRPLDALKHPTWSMGPKNTIDSATMANKGLELIETRYLFDVDASKIDVVIHPDSIVHSLLRTIDGFYYAQISQPDMRMVIQNALSFPELHPAEFGTIDLFDRQICFYPVDYKKYRLLRCAYQALEQEGAYPIVFNAANEVAYHAFMAEKISFVRISEIVEETLSVSWSPPARTVEDILEVDRAAREKALSIVKNKVRVVSQL